MGGFYALGQSNIERREYRQEKLQRRAYLLPFLQAEADARYEQARRKAVAEEAEIMKDIPGWAPGASVYKGGRWAPPASTHKLGGTGSGM